MVFRKDVASRGVTYYNIGGKKLMNVFCSERPNVMCCANADDGGTSTFSLSRTTIANNTFTFATIY
jgi:hypothetical protein